MAAGAALKTVSRGRRPKSLASTAKRRDTVSVIAPSPVKTATLAVTAANPVTELRTARKSARRPMSNARSAVRWVTSPRTVPAKSLTSVVVVVRRDTGPSIAPCQRLAVAAAKKATNLLTVPRSASTNVATAMPVGSSLTRQQVGFANASAVGHLSRECPKPRDYSRVQCRNCQECK